MKRFYSLLALLVLLLPSVVQAQLALGTTAATFTFAPSKVIADPVRRRVYALLTSNNSLVVINTNTLQVTATIPIGSVPIDMAISPDDSTLYVADNAATLGAVSVVNLNTLKVTDRLPLNGFATAIAAGLNNQLYVAAIVNLVVDGAMGAPPTTTTVGTIYQLDATTHAMRSFGPALPPAGMAPTGTVVTTNFLELKLNPNDSAASRLYTAGSGGLFAYSVNSTPPTQTVNNPTLGVSATQLIVSNSGLILCAPQPGGDSALTPPTTVLTSAPGLFNYYGVLSATGAPGPLAFSPHDSFVYQTRFTANFVLDVFTTPNFQKLNEIDLAANNLPLTGTSPVTVAIDNTGSYLFIGQRVNTATDTTGQMLVITTGGGTLTPPSLIPVITSTLTANAVEGTPFSYAITATNTPTSFDASGLPMGLVVDPATGLITGTPTEIGIFDVTISATNASGTDTEDLVLTVDPGADTQTPVITTVSLPDGVAGQFYSTQVTASNGPTGYGATGLPPGLNINATTGVIAGIPSQPGLYAVTLSASNNFGSGSATLPLTITGVAVAPPVITSGKTAATSVGSPFTYQITATNSPTSFGASGLPAGLSVNSLSGIISGTVSTVGTYTIFVSASNAGGLGTAVLTLTVSAVPAPVITSPTEATGTLGQAFSYQIIASNNPSSYAASGLPPGLAINTVNGLINGVPLAPGTFPVTVTATNVSATGTITLTLTIASDVPVVEIMSTVPTVTAGTSDSAAVTFTRTGDLSQPLFIAYAIKGSARNGVDYQFLTGRIKIKPNRTSRTLQITPLKTAPGTALEVIKLVIQPAVTYQIGTQIRAKVKILPKN